MVRIYNERGNGATGGNNDQEAGSEKWMRHYEQNTFEIIEQFLEAIERADSETREWALGELRKITDRVKRARAAAPRPGGKEFLSKTT